MSGRAETVNEQMDEREQWWCNRWALGGMFTGLSLPGAEGLNAGEMGARVAGEGQELAGPYLAALTSDAAVVITGCLVPTHDTLLVFVQVTRDIPWEGGREAGRQAWFGPPAERLLHFFIPQLFLPGPSPSPASLTGFCVQAESWRHIRGHLVHPLP